jgi:hypothetical protein
MKSIKDITNAEFAASIEIDLKEIERWSRVEGKLGEFKRIRPRFARRET